MLVHMKCIIEDTMINNKKCKLESALIKIIKDQCTLDSGYLYAEIDSPLSNGILALEKNGFVSVIINTGQYMIAEWTGIFREKYNP